MIIHQSELQIELLFFIVVTILLKNTKKLLWFSDQKISFLEIEYASVSFGYTSGMSIIWKMLIIHSCRHLDLGSIIKTISLFIMLVQLETQSIQSDETSETFDTFQLFLILLVNVNWEMLSLS